MKTPHTHWMLCLTLFSVAGLLLLAGGCPPPPPADTGGDTTGGDTSGGGGTGGGDTGGGTAGGDTGGGTTGGDTGGGTTGGDTGGGDTGGGTTGGDTGGDTGGGSGGGSGGGGTPPTPPTQVTLSAIAKTGDAVPGQPTGTTFTKFGKPVIDSQGRVAFWGLYAGTGAVGDAGLYVWDGTAVKLVVHDDPATAGIVPGRATSDYFGNATTFDPREYDLAWGGGDRLIFACTVAGERVSSGFFRWRASDGDLARVADAEQMAGTFSDVQQGEDGPVFGLNTFYVGGVSDTGIATIAANYTYIKNSGQGFEQFVLNKNGVFTSNGTTVTRIADDSTQKTGVVPDQDATAYFALLTIASTQNAGGDLLMQSRYASSSAGGRGAYLRRGGNLYRVIDTRSGASWDGLPAGTQVGQAEMRLAIGPAGHIAIDTTLTVGSATDDAVIIWDWDGGKWTELTGPGDAPATALVSGVNDDGQVLLLSGGNPYVVSAAGRVQVNAALPAELRSAVLKWSDSGGAINNHWRAAVPYTNGGKVALAFWTGAKLLVVADVTLDEPTGITDIHTIAGSERDRPGRNGLLNDADELVFRATMSDASEVIYLVTGE